MCFDAAAFILGAPGDRGKKEEKETQQKRRKEIEDIVFLDRR